MVDQWADQLYEASYGGLRIDVLSLQDDLSRALARYKYPHRDGADVEDMGAEEWTTRARVIFFPRDGQNARDVFEEFMAIVQRGESQVFVHPLFGEHDVKVGQLGTAIAAELRDAIMVECEFVEDTADATIFEPGAGLPVTSSIDEVTAISGDIDDGLVQVNEREDLDEPLTTTVGADAIAEITSWEEDDSITERDVRFGAATLAGKINSETDRLELALHVERYPLVTAFARLHWAVRRASEAFIQRTPRLMDITVRAPTPLLVIAARTYGADQADARYQQLLELNDVRKPNRVPAGTVLKAQVPDSQRVKLRRAA